MPIARHLLPLPAHRPTAVLVLPHRLKTLAVQPGQSEKGHPAKLPAGYPASIGAQHRYRVHQVHSGRVPCADMSVSLDEP
jgi:hypothetical protein